MDRGRVSVLVYHGKPETSVQVRKGQLPRISEATSIGYELRSYRMDVTVHPYTEVTEKQKAAMKEAGVNYTYQSVYELTYNCLIHLLDGR